MIDFPALPGRLQQQARELYVAEQLRSAVPYAAAKSAFEPLSNDEKNAVAARLYDVHALLAYELHTKLIPSYMAHHARGGTKQFIGSRSKRAPQSN